MNKYLQFTYHFQFRIFLVVFSNGGMCENGMLSSLQKCVVEHVIITLVCEIKKKWCIGMQIYDS